MLRLLIPLLASGLLIAGLWFLYRAFTQVDFAYIRFRNGVLTLQRKGVWVTDEVEFKPGAEFDSLDSTQLVSLADRLDWYEFPSGHLIEAGSPEHEGITRALRFAHNTKLLAAELSTE